MENRSPKIIIFLLILVAVTIFLAKSAIKFNNYQNKGDLTFASCQLIDVIWQRRKCWNNLLEYTLNRQGLKEAFKLFSKIYSSDPITRNHCHDWGHTLGRAAYKLYGSNLELIPESTYCEYGFYHGFILALTVDTGDLEKAIGFCQTVDKKFGTPAKIECIRAIGSGVTELSLQDKQNWGSFEKTTFKSLAFCKSVFLSDELSECYDGVFNYLAQAIAQSAHGFSFKEYMSKSDPFFECHNLGDNYQESCFTHFTDLLPIRFGRYGIYQAVNVLLSSITNRNYLHRPIERISRYYTGFDIIIPNNNNYSIDIEVCRHIPSTLFKDCLQGIIHRLSFSFNVTPEKEFTKVLAFCGANYLSESEKTSCISIFMESAKDLYDPNTFSALCNQIDKKYQVLYCHS